MKHNDEASTELKYPWQREWITDALTAFSDVNFQRRMWVEERGKDPNRIENLDANIDVLYEDSAVARDPYGCIGISLRTDEEARAIEHFDHVFSAFYDHLPPRTDDATVISMPGWRDVVAAAKEALDLLTEEQGS